MRTMVVFGVRTLFLTLLIISLATTTVLASNMTNLRVMPSVDYTSTMYHSAEITNMTLYFDYADQILGVLQDWNATIYVNGIANVTLPRSKYRWTFDYDNSSAVVDQSISLGYNDGSRGANMMNDAYLYLSFEDVVGDVAKDWGTYGGNNNLTFTGGARRVKSETGMALQTNGNFAAAGSTDFVNFTLAANSSFQISAFIQDHEDYSGDHYFMESNYYSFRWGADDFKNTWRISITLWNGTYRTLRYTIPKAWENQTWIHTLHHDNSSGWTGIFLNGTLYNSTTWEDNQPLPIDYIGRTGFPSDYVTNMTIDEVQVYNTTTHDINNTFANHTCQYGYCYMFDGTNDRIDIPSETYDLDAGTTFSFWAHPTILSDNPTVLGYSAISTYSFLLFRGADGALQLETDTNADFGLSDPITHDGLHHYVVSCENYRCTFYQDGVNITLAGLNQTLENNITFDQIGGAHTASKNFMGVIDDVVIWDTSLTAEQVQYFYSQDVSILNPSNGSYTANVSYYYGQMFNNISNNTNVYDVLLQLFMFDTLSNVIPTFYVNGTNLNNTESHKNVVGTGGVARINGTIGVYEINASVNGSYTNYTGIFDVNDTFFNISFEVSQLVNILIIDESTGKPFDYNNISSLKMYNDDNITAFDFQAQSTSNTTVVLNDTNKLRIEFLYVDGTVINRFIDTSLFTSGQVKVCGNLENVNHYEQLIIASTERPALLKNSYTECYVAADYTRFAYQSAFLLRAFTIESVYELTTISDGVATTLVNIDGSVASYLNVDTIEFQKRAYDFNILSEVLAFNRREDANGVALNEIEIFYNNTRQSSNDITVTITRMDTDELVYYDDDLPNPNQFQIIFNYNALTGITNNTLFKIEVLTESDGTFATLKRYFNTAGQRGILQSALGFVLAFFLMVFGITFTLTRLSFSWFGIFISMIAIGITALSITEWYITMLQGICVIVMIYQLIMMTTLYKQTVV